MYQMSLRLADHTRRYSVSAAVPSGWEITLVEDARVRRRDRYDDWHRLERALNLVKLEVDQLTARGWVACES